MNAPLIWIGLPILLSLLLWLPSRPKTTALLGGLSAFLLSALALTVPIDTPFRLSETLSVKIADSIEILGREIVITSADQSLLALLYGIAAIWFFASAIAGVARPLVPLGMAILALLIASLAVTPFLYAALIIQTAILLAVPLLSPPEQKPGRGVIRFLIYQTLAMPFILFSGWLLAGVESSPGDIELLTQAATLLALGFAFLLAIFPLYTWIPLLMEEASPYAVGFILWLLPAATLLFALGFLDRYAWLREFAQLPHALRLAGLIMITTGGIWAAFERHLGRIMGYAAIVNTGFSLLAMSLLQNYRLSAFFMLMIPQALSLILWSLALTVLKREKKSLNFREMQGLIQQYPILVSGLLLAHFSALGMPLLAGFPPILAIWEGVAREKMIFAFWVGVGIASLLTSALRSLAVFVMTPKKENWRLGGGWAQNIFLGLGIILLFVLGLFPQLIYPILVDLPKAFEHFGG
jgi:formate hydrogenlyase subunit 3/multisubunit Na+/H+ antiporter MnhD subunit